MAREVEKRPKRLFRWSEQNYPARLPETVSGSAWQRGTLVVLSSLDRNPAVGLEWHLSISKFGSMVDDEAAREVLAEFDMSGAVEDENADADTLAGLGRRALARHYILEVPKC